MTTTIADRVIAVTEQLAGREVNCGDDLVKDVELDSLDRIQLAMEIETAFGIDIPDEDVDRPELGTIDGLIAYVEGRLDRAGVEL